MLGTQRLPVPSLAFDAVHCANCRIDWQSDGGVLLLEVNRVLRPGGFFIWSASPVSSQKGEHKTVWEGERRGGAASIGAGRRRKPKTDSSFQAPQNFIWSASPVSSEEEEYKCVWEGEGVGRGSMGDRGKEGRESLPETTEGS